MAQLYCTLLVEKALFIPFINLFLKPFHSDSFTNSMKDLITVWNTPQNVSIPTVFFCFSSTFHFPLKTWDPYEAVFTIYFSASLCGLAETERAGFSRVLCFFPACLVPVTPSIWKLYHDRCFWKLSKKRSLVGCLPRRTLISIVSQLLCKEKRSRSLQCR